MRLVELWVHFASIIHISLSVFVCVRVLICEICCDSQSHSLTVYCRGIPVWLKYVPGVSFRTDNEPFKVGLTIPLTWFLFIVSSLG